MMEIAGLVLGALPLIITALDRYRDALDPFRDYWRYNSYLKSLQLRFRLEQQIYRDNLKRLLVSELTASELEQLFTDSEKSLQRARELWGTAEIEQKLSSRLRSGYGLFMEIIREMGVTIQKLMDKLDIDPYQLCEKSRSGIAWEWRKLRRSFGKKEREALIQELAQFNKKISQWVQNNEILAPPATEGSNTVDGAEYLSRVREEACNLYQFLEQAWGCNCASAHDVHLQLDQRKDIRDSPLFQVHFSLSPQSSKGQSDCKNKIWHETHIRLEELKDPVVTDSGTHLSPAAEGAPKPYIQRAIGITEVMAKHGRKGGARALSFQVPDAPACTAAVPRGRLASAKTTHLLQSSMAKRIVCLCKELRNAPETNSKCLGILADASRRVCANITTTTNTNTVSPNFPAPVGLGSYLPLRSGSYLPLRSGTSYRSRSTRLSRQERLAIAVTLSCTVLQLYESPWLNDFWNKSDIFVSLPNKGAIQSSPAPNLHVVRSFLSPAAKAALAPVHPMQPTKPGPVASGPNQSLELVTQRILNKTLFSLGVILIELCLNRPIEDFLQRREPELEHQPGCTSEDTTAHDRDNGLLDAYEVANSRDVLDEVYSEGGDQYGYIVQRCLRCEFPIADCNKQMSIFEFRRVVYQGVVMPLMQNYKNSLLVLRPAGFEIF